MDKAEKLTAEQMQALLEEADAFWLYSGKPRKDQPHALLTSGKHSDGYVNVGQVMKEKPIVRGIFAMGMLDALYKEWNGEFNWVVGADTSSTDLAKDVANLAGVGHITMLKIEGGGDKRQVWAAKNTLLQDGETILHIEELVTTSLSALQVRQGIRLANPGLRLHFVPFLPVVVERSDPENRVVLVEDSKILPLLQLCIRTYEPNPADCPYCAVGSPAIKPKANNNWLKLTGK